MKSLKLQLILLGSIVLVGCVPFKKAKSAPQVSNSSSGFSIQTSTAGMSLPTNESSGRIQGFILDNNGPQFFQPGPALSVYRPGWFGPSITPGNQFFSMETPSGLMNFGATIPRGYSAEISVCVQCTNHPPESFRPYLRGTGPLVVNVPASGYIDVYIRYSPNPSEYAPADTNKTITCNHNSHPSTTHEETYAGTGVRARLAISAPFAGIATAFELSNTEADDRVNILAPGAGATMQTTWGGFAAEDPGRRIGVDQGVGGAFLQWGSGGSFAGLRQQDWTPLWTGSIAGLENTPCYNSASYIFDGKQNITGELVPTAHGNAIRVVNEYSYRPTRSWTWTDYRLEQAFYLNKAVAKSRFLRVYLFGAGGAWSEGPIVPYESFKIDHHAGPCDMGTDPLQRWGCFTQPLDYALFVYSIGGKDIGVVIRPTSNRPFFGSLNMMKTMACQDANNPECGDLEWHSFHRAPEIDGVSTWSMQQGSIYTEAMSYTVGTLQQLADLGYGTLPSSPVANTPVTSGGGTSPLAVYENFGSAASSDFLCPANAAIDRNPGTSYCSRGHDSSANNSGTDLAVWFGDGPHPVNRVFLYARVNEGQVRAFPTHYHIYLTSPDNSSWIWAGEFWNQPDASGMTGINLPLTYQTYGIRIVPVEYGKDEFGAYAFQLSELKLGYVE